ncbi:MAG: hypothetical protein M1822_001454 [Bathelium mastoideum]|nr:MAG: hypothetical protein M1822_001454 [Bathelium mastoideum]
MKVLPELLKSVEFGGGGPKVFRVVVTISSKLSDEEFDAQITPVVVRLFASQDRAMRVCLLDSLPLIIDHLPQKLVTDKIFPQMVTGFTDVAPLVREQTVKAVLTVVGKLSDRVINGELLRHLAKTANDEQPGIRTNTTICLGKIAKNLGTNTRAKVLTAAFSRSLRDPFLHARNAALLALAATSDCFSEEDSATKILPAICPSLVDKEKLVRDQANKALDLYLQRIRKYSATLPDTIQPTNISNSSTAPIPRMSTPQNDTSWAGWAISSFTNKLSSAQGEIKPGPAITTDGTGSRPQHNRTTSDQTVSLAARHPPTKKPTSPSPLHRQALSSSSPALPSPSETDLMSTSTPSVAEDFNEPWADDFTVGANTTNTTNDDLDDFNDAWGEDPFSASTNGKSSTEAAPTFDDKGEPDFAGWLAAQTQSKAKTKKTSLPKGLAKTTAAPRPGVVGRSNTTGTAPEVGQRKKEAAHGVAAAVGTGKVAKSGAKKEETATGDDEGWGDAWE